MANFLTMEKGGNFAVIINLQQAGLKFSYLISFLKKKSHMSQKNSQNKSI